MNKYCIQYINMDDFETKARGKPQQTFRLTGRDGPPGSIMIPGVPAWLARGTPVFWYCTLIGDYLKRNGIRDPNTRGMPETYLKGNYRQSELIRFIFYKAFNQEKQPAME